MVVEFTAITNPPESDVDSWDGLPLGGFDLEANKAKARFFASGVHRVTANIGLSSAFVDITVFGLVIVLEPDPHDGAYVISADPAMPVIKANAVGIPVVTPATAVEWTVVSRFRGDDDCLPMSSGSVQQTEFPQPQQASITLDWDGKITGNTVDIAVEAVVGGCLLAASTKQPIKGTNPSRSYIEAALPHKTLRAIACVESDQRQFDASPDGGTARCPLFGPDGAVGVMGLDGQPPDEAFWDWRANVKGGIDKFNDARDVAKRYPREVRNSAEFQRQKTRLNEIRASLGHEPVTVDLPDFSEGDFDSDLKQLERDTIRGYDGYSGNDGFGTGGEVHEFRVKMGEFQGEQLPSLIINEGTRAATAQWEQVPTADRPAGPWDPNYVDRVMARLDGCREVEPPSCQVKILSPGETRSFHPPSSTHPTDPGNLSGKETFNAVISGSPPTPHTIEWHVEAIAGWTGSIDFGDLPHDLAVTAQAKHPNKSRISVNVVHDGQIVCTHETTASVPQFFHILFSTAFDLDLERLGLRRRAAPSGNLTQSQKDTNDKVRAAVIQEILDSARSVFNAGTVINNTINVRFTLDLPPNVTAENITVATIGGLDPEHRSFGRTSPGTSAGNPADIGNPDAKQTIDIFPRHIMDRTFLDPSAITILDQIFGELSEGLDGSHLPGVAVDSGEFVPLNVHPTEPNVVRKRTIQAAIQTFGRLVGSMVVHEAGHALGLAHAGAEPESPMDDGRTFKSRTGVTSFDPATGNLSSNDPARFSPSQQRYLENILKILN
jgi:hypothetical protein